MRPNVPRRLARSGAVYLTVVSVLSLSLVACSSRPTNAYCVDTWAPAGSSYRVVSDRYCDNGGTGGRYRWYYRGRYRSGYVSRGIWTRPRGKIVSRGGRVLQRGSRKVTTRTKSTTHHSTSGSNHGSTSRSRSRTRTRRR
ncbi:hypothetical protein GCM10023196_032580 [Actinoallomurus vinaceus]|uniref:Lipoprotein n=1 Tax=Actinoallomurus vinaceus TaxID=1080074 RepID=A0ABP8UBA5_9ACTN